MKLLHVSNEGFSLVEVLLAGVIFAVLATAVVGAFVYGRQATYTTGDRARAMELADEAVQAVRNIRNAAYANLVDGTYGLAQTSGTWTLSGSSDVSGIYTRQVVIATSGTNRKTVTATVTWPQAVGTGQVTASSQLTNWLAALAAKSWPGGILTGTANGPSTADGIKIATAGNYTYLVQSNASGANFAIFNIATPSAPTLVSSLTLAATPTNIFVSGNYAYVTSSNDSAELQIINIATPASPSLVSSFNAPGSGDGLAVFVSGNTAYLSRAANGGLNEFMIINVTTPTLPIATGSYGVNANLSDVIVSGNYAYVASSVATQELLVLNITLPILPTLASSYNLVTGGTVNAMALTGNTLLIGQSSSLSIINVSTPTSLTRTGTVTATGSAAINDVTTNGTYAFLATNNSSAEFQIVDITNPTSASVVRTVDVPNSSQLYGVAYNSSLDAVAGASAGNIGEVRVFIPN